MSASKREAYDRELERIDKMSDAELSALIHGDQCPHPSHLMPSDVGLYHCPLCGESVLAGQYHPRCVGDLIDLDPPEGEHGFRDY